MAEAVAVKGLTKRFGGFTAVDGIDLTVGQGEIFGFLGPNGAGKSTTIRMLCGILRPSGGSGRVAGLDLFRDAERIKQRIGYMSQQFSLYDDLTPQENLRLFLGIYRVAPALWAERIAEAAAAVGLGSDLHRVVRGLPPGVRQRLALACALLHRPTLLFLDEPTAGVDPLARRAFWASIRGLSAQGVSVFVSTHHLEEADHCGRVALIHAGRIVACGPPRRLVAEAFPGRAGAGLEEAFAFLLQRGAA
ncbi:MAG: ABC transporter ATP-binding protein [Desulfobacterales bacterium]